jgi:broad specificity phosphatase PhoE
MTVSAASLACQPPRSLRILVVRHGQTRHNIEGIIQGQLDTPLNAFGRLQASTTGDHLSTTRIDRIITSPLQRARHTAEAIASKQAGIAKVQVEQDDRIQERGFGTLEGKSHGGSHKKSEAVIEGMESAAHLQERLAAFWNELVTVHVPSKSQDYATAGQHQKQEQDQGQEEQVVLLVSHGAAISSLLNDVLLLGHYIQLLPDVQVSQFGNCSITELVVPTTLDYRTPSALGHPGAFHLKHEWVVRPQHFISEVSIAQKLQDHGKVVLQDLFFGEGVGVVERWADSEHVRGLIQPTEEGGQEQGRGQKINVDELVGK